MNATERRDAIRDMLADLKMPGALEAVDRSSATSTAAGVQRVTPSTDCCRREKITLRNNRRLQHAMRSSRLPAS